MKPFVKWTGGKTKLLGQLAPLFPKRVGTYYEPFVGGGALFWHFAETKRFDRAVVNDWNQDLIETYKVVRDFPDDLVKRLESLAKQYPEGPLSIFTCWQRPDTVMQRLLEDDPILRATRLIFLIKTCFNGLYRVNKKGEFNTSWGKNPKANICDEPTLRECSEVLQQFVRIMSGDFAAAVADAKDGDAVYFDPPYVPLSATSNFTSYTSDGFTFEDQKRLAQLVRDLMDKGVAVVASNSDTPVVRELYQGLEIREVQAPRSINVKGDGRGLVGELVIVGRKAR